MHAIVWQRYLTHLPAAVCCLSRQQLDAYDVAMQGDYYHYTILSPAHQEKLRLNAYYFNKDYYGTIYQVSML